MSNLPPDDLTNEVVDWLTREYPGLTGHELTSQDRSVWIDGTNGWVGLWMSERFLQDEPRQRMENLKHVLYNRIQHWNDPVPEPPPISFPARQGGVSTDGNRQFQDGGGRFVALCKSLFFGPSYLEFRPDHFREDVTILAQHGFNTLRQFCFLDRNWEAGRDPWEVAGNTSVPRFMAAVREARKVGLRTLATYFGGLGHWRNQDQRINAVRELTAEIKVNRDLFVGGEMMNEEWMNWRAFSNMQDMRELVAYVKNEMPDFPIACSSPVSGEQGPLEINEWFRTIKDMYYESQANMTTYHFDRDSKKVDGIWRPYRQPRENPIVVPAPDERQNIAGTLGLPPGTQLVPTLGINQEPIGVDSSGEQDDNPDRQVIAAVITFVCGMALHCFHTDYGVWGDFLLPEYRRGSPDRPGSRGVTARLMQTRNVGTMLRGFAGMMQEIPQDLPSWPRTRHGLEGHPFGPSFQQTSTGFTQIWPDGVTFHGVVRAYAAYRGNEFWVPLLGVRDHFDAVMWKRSQVRFIKPSTWETIEEGTWDAGQTVRVTYPEVVAVGKHV